MTHEEEMNRIASWRKGVFVDQLQNSRWSEEAKQDARMSELLNVRPSPTGNALCRVAHPDNVVWIAKRLNKLARIEQAVRRFQKGDLPYLQITELLDEEF